MAIDVVLGLQRGDEGKGRIVDLIAEQYDAVARFNGGPNAGHTIAYQDTELRLHQIPSGISRKGILNIIGNGALIDPIRFQEEVTHVEQAGLTVTPENLAISDIAHLILPHHIALDELREASTQGQGSTKRGIAFTAADKYERCGARTELIVDDEQQLQDMVVNGLLRVNELRAAAELPLVDTERVAANWLVQAEKLRPFIADTVHLTNALLIDRKNILAEGAQAFGLDVEHGIYPYVTSSHTTTAGAATGLGVAPRHIGKVTGVAKMIRSHVGGGPFITKIEDEELASTLRGKKGEIDAEIGVSTGRNRHLGYFDIPELKKAIRINGVDRLALTKLDSVRKFGRSMLIATAYDVDGLVMKEAPSSAVKIARSRPIYEEMPLWDENISDIRRFKDLPQAAQKLVNFIAIQLNTPVTTIGVGPYRDQIIHV